MHPRLVLGIGLACLVTMPITWAQTARRPASPPPRQQVLATINGFNVTPLYLNRLIEQRFAREIIDEVVRARVIEDEARAKGVRVSHEQVTAQIEREKSDFPTEEDFAAHVRSLGFSEKGYREHVRTQLLLAALLNQAAAVSDAEARAYYDAHRAEFGSETQLHILDLPAATEDDALVAYRAIADGTPFDVAARRFGAQPLPGRNGDLGWLTREAAPQKAVWDAASALSVGEMTEPFEVDGRFHIIRLVGRRAGQTHSFAAVKDAIKARLRELKGINEADYVTSLIAKATISINWDPVRYLQDEYAQLKGPRVAVDGRVLRLSPPPYIAPGGVTMVPAKPVLKAIGATVVWRPGAKVMEIRRGTRTATVNLGERIAIVNGQRVDLTAPAVVKDGVLFIPPRAVVVGLGAEVAWNHVTKLLTITTQKPQ